jgi:hypothetical protein
VIWVIAVSIAITLLTLGSFARMLIEAERDDRYDEIQKMFWG